MDKNQFRKMCIQKLKRVSSTQKYRIKKRLNQNLMKVINKEKVKSILIFWPLDFEADIKPSILKLRQTKKLYIPFMLDVSFKMVTFRLPLYKKKFNIYEAGYSIKDIKKVDMVIVPIVGLDKNGARVGFGKGMYDRFFEKLDNNPIKVFTQNKLCYTNTVVTQDHDVIMDYLVTAKKIYKKPKELGLRNKIDK